MVLAALCGFLLQSQVHLNHDVGWVLYSSGRMLDGQVFSRDIVAANPPLIWYLNLAPAWIAEVTGIAAPTAFRLFIIGLAALCLVLAAEAMKGTSWGRDRLLTQGLIALAAIHWLILSGREFGQREHLVLMLATPYLMLSAADLAGGRSPVGLRIACGVLAAVGFCLKPHFLAVPFLIESHHLLWRRSPRAALRPQVVAMAATGLLYLLSIPLAAPDYLGAVLPLVRAIYWGFDGSAIGLLARIWAELLTLPLLIVLLIANRGRPRDLHWVLGLASAGMLLAYFLQRKGFAYHALPFQGFLLLWIFVAVGGLFRSSARVRSKPIAWLWGLVAASALALPLLTDAVRVTLWHRDARVPSGAFGAQSEDLIALVNRHAAGGFFAAFSTHPYPGFPIANYAQAAWGARTNSHLMIPAIARMREGGGPDGPHREEIERAAHHFVIEDMRRFRPALVLLDDRDKRYALRGSDFDMLEFYLEDARFREIWSAYFELAPLHGFRVFVRGREGAQP